MRYLFLDLNAYFASVEQQERPELRGRPVAVVPMMADSTFVIAASYEAKKRGVRTGTRVGDARSMCPEIELVEARPSLYVHYHNRVVETVESVLPVHRVCSVDEMSVRLLGDERDPDRARAIAAEIKTRLRKGVGECIRASIGIAPNEFLAKVGTEMMKPDGLVVLEAGDLPERLFGLKLTDFSGINRRMAARIQAAGIFTAQQLCQADRRQLREAFGSIVGERWWYLLRGIDLPQRESERKSLSHSHVLPPELRTDEGCRQVLLRLLQKAAARLRANGLAAGRMSVGVSGRQKWEAEVRLDPTNDTATLNDAFLRLWAGRRFVGPLKAGVAFGDLVPAADVTPSLFGDAPRRAELSRAIDALHAKYGKNRVFLAGMERARDAAPERIAFAKTELFAEGKGDNQWRDTFRGLR
ncbi:MAG: DNA polymerase [Fimbriimonadaceae bacterium]